MKNARKLLLLLLTLALALTLFACGGGDKCEEHEDKNNDGKCDNCGETVKGDPEEAKLLLFDNGVPTFQFVLENGSDKAIRKLVDDYVDAMKDFDIDISVVADRANTEAECEILIGNIENRDAKYLYDVKSLGKKGYAIKIIDSKVIIKAGSVDALEEAVDEFIYDILLFDEDAEEIGTVHITESQEILMRPDYSITSLKVNGVDSQTYTIATDMTNTVYLKAATALQDAIYERAGNWLEIVSLDKADKSIVIKAIDKVYDQNSFKVSVNDKNQLVIECAFENKLEESVLEFVNSKITLAKGDVEFKGTVMTNDISFLTYEEFGAKGDGRTNDFAALYNTHVAANEYGQNVKGKSGAKYYIDHNKVNINGQARVVVIPVKTNVDWTGAKFVIDDSDIDMFDSVDRQRGAANIFEVQSDYAKVRITDTAVLNAIVAAGLNPNTAKVDLGLGYAAMIMPYNNSNKIYRRLGYGSYAGQVMHEVIVLDKDGNIDLTSESKTPVMFDYTHLDYIDVYRIDEVHLTLKGGTFTHIGHRVDAEIMVTVNGVRVEKQAGYIYRGLNVKRSFTTVQDVVHNIENEITMREYSETEIQSSPYRGFYTAANCTNVTFKDCTLTARRYYDVQGTYEFGADNVNKIVLDNCHQQNFWVVYDPDTELLLPAKREDDGAMTSMERFGVGGISTGMHWGVGGTNFCKNMEYLNSTLSRFDAHEGLYNGKIINSTINSMELIGNGDFIMENVDWYSKRADDVIFQMRSDYGATWDGTIYAKDLRAYIPDTGATLTLMYHSYANWYWGYRVCIPNLTLDNFKLYSDKSFTELSHGRSVRLVSNTMASEPNMHLETTFNTDAIYPYADYDGDGYVDNVPGDMVYDASTASDPSNWRGISVFGERKNLGRVTPPSEIKIINDNIDLNVVVWKTVGAPTADPGVTLPAGVEANGGFFGMTKFTYGTGENDYVIGTNHSQSGPFNFQ